MGEWVKNDRKYVITIDEPYTQKNISVWFTNNSSNIISEDSINNSNVSNGYYLFNMSTL